jgi:uncharacterized protein YcaQ
MKAINITKAAARQFLLEYQGLGGKHTFSGKQGIYDYIKKVGCIQFDPLNIVGHNHELVLQSRIKGFKPEQLQELLYGDRKLIDGWDKNMSIYCTSDWPYFKRLRDSERQRLQNSPINKVLPLIREAIEERGPLSSTDLDYQETVDWSWAPARISRAAMESMYFWGELIIHHKAYTRRLYDFASRHLPEELLSAPDPNPDDSSYFAWYVLRRIGSIGMLWNKAGDAWLGISGLKAGEREKAFQLLLEENKLIELQVEDIKQPLYIRSEDRHLLDNVSDGLKAKKAYILAPLDNLLWDRRLIRELFDFSYVWEVYKPEAERVYGYYVLPVLYGDRFAARFEPGWDRQTNTLIIKNWWWEPGVKQTAALKKELGRCFRSFAEYLNAEYIKLENKAEEARGLDWLNTIKEN